MNYRHAFHAGNFADLVKHAALLDVLRRLQASTSPLTIIDTHAGRGRYDLAGAEARRSGEAEAGIQRLMRAADAPQVLADLVAAVRRLNGGGAVRRYPGSPWLIAETLRPQDRFIACELRPDEHAALRDLLKGRPGVETICGDGFAVAVQRTPAAGRVLLVIDPPFERADDYARIVEVLCAATEQNPDVAALVWLPLKDLETFDGFRRELEDRLERPALVAETRMRPLTDPMRMNGCALVMVSAPPGAAPGLEAAATWTALALGEGGSARVYGL